MTPTRKKPGSERFRGPNLEVSIWGNPRIPMEEALRRADDAGLVIVSNKQLSKVLVGSDKWRGISESFPFWSGTMAAYDGPNEKVGKLIEYTDSGTGIRYLFPVPEEHWGKKNIIMVAKYPNVSLVKDGNDRIVQATDVDVIDRFPTSKEGWFLGDQKYDIPQGDKVDGSNPDARYLWRMDSRVSLVARVCWHGCYRRDVDLSTRPSAGLGVAVEGTPEQIAAAARLIEQIKVK